METYNDIKLGEEKHLNQMSNQVTRLMDKIVLRMALKQSGKKVEHFTYDTQQSGIFKVICRYYKKGGPYKESVLIHMCNSSIRRNFNMTLREYEGMWMMMKKSDRSTTQASHIAIAITTISTVCMAVVIIAASLSHNFFLEWTNLG